jgi:hypothetical protein
VGRPLRHHPVEGRPLLLECTCRTVQGRRLLRPSDEVNLIVIGILGRALKLTPGVRLIEFSVVSDHYHIVLEAADENCLARFFNIVNSQLATRVGAGLYGWDSKVWSRRYRSIPILDDESMVARVRYVYEQGLHHDLVDDPVEMPGAQSLRARLFGERLVGKWFDGSGFGRAKRRKKGRAASPNDFWVWYEIELAPLPCWAHLSAEDYRRQVQDLCTGILVEHQARWETTGTRPIGAAAMRAASPTARPMKAPATSPAPWCHGATKVGRAEYLWRLREFHEAYDPASAAFRGGKLDVDFPTWCFRPLGPYERNGEEPPAMDERRAVREVPPPL